MRVLRAADRFRTEQPGILTRHCFSAGAHYEPDNLSFGPVLGCDEHLLAPGAGFEEHAHRGVEILSWVRSGGLAHSDSRGASRLLGPGELMVQSTGGGVRHTERNASTDIELRFVQLTLLDGVPYEFEIVTTSTDITASWLHLFVAAGTWAVDGLALHSGDSVRTDARVTLDGRGEILALGSPAFT